MTTSFKVVYWKGLRCYHSLREGWNPQEGGEEATLSGVLSKYRYRNPGSPSFEWRIRVPCWFDQLTPISGLDAETTMHLALAQVKRDFMSHALETAPLSWCMNDTHVGEVSGTYAAGLRAVAVTGLPGDWTPTTGRHVLFRDPTSGEGFHAQIVGYAGGAITANLSQAIDADWEVVSVQIVFPDVEFKGIDQGAQTTVLDNFRAEVNYEFAGNADPIFASAYNQDLS